MNDGQKFNCAIAKAAPLMVSLIMTGCQTPLRTDHPRRAEPLAVRSLSKEQLVSRIAFGSCARQNEPQPIWDAILELQPELFLFIGDNIYGDTEDMDELRTKYGELAAQAGFRRLRESCPILATWDDHDYGLNDAGAEYSQRDESQRVFCDFFDEPANAPRRQRAGIYDSRIFGPPGRRAQIILLDTRYFRSALLPGEYRGLNPDGKPGGYLPDTSDEATLLGPAQWAWLEEQLQQPAELRIIASSIQFVSQEHGFEKWMNFPRERRRLCDLIAKTRAGGVILVSGDRHKADLSRLDEDTPYPLYDLTSSALNQQSDWYNEINRHRIGTEYRLENFGLIEIDWGDDPTISLQIRKLDGEAAIVHDVPLAQLQPAAVK